MNLKKPIPPVNKTGEIPDWEIVQDDQGRVLGKATAKTVEGKRIILPRDLVPYVKEFLSQLQKEKRERDMGKNQDKKNVNMAFIAGTVKSIKVRASEGSAFLLVDTEADTNKWIPCTVHEDKENAKKLERFESGDFIQVNGYVRVWSQKVDGEWKNNAEVRIARIANEPPQRERRTVQNAANDDDIPF